MSSIPTEHIEQRNFVVWFRQNHRGTRIFAIPNGGARAKATAMQLKLEGVLPGVPDLYVPAWSLWVEMKRKKGGRLSDHQKDWIEYLEGIGHTVLVCKGCVDAIAQVNNYLAR